MLRTFQAQVRFWRPPGPQFLIHSRRFKVDSTKPDRDREKRDPPPNQGSFGASGGDLKKGIIPNSIKYVGNQNRKLADWVGTKLHEVQSQVFTASKTLNDITGYTSIEKLKQSIEQQGENIRRLKNDAQQANEIYKRAIEDRSASQRELGNLLQRKNEWSASDLETFTNLYRDEHKREQEEQSAKSKLSEVERELDNAQLELSRSILARYKEEQIWSDKIRRASTGGTIAVMVFNMLLFIIIQLGVEPWRRERLVGSFEDKVKEALRKQRQELMNQTQNNDVNDSHGISEPNLNPVIVMEEAKEKEQEEKEEEEEKPDFESELVHQETISESALSPVSTTEYLRSWDTFDIYAITNNLRQKVEISRCLQTFHKALERMTDYNTYIGAYTKAVDVMSTSNRFVSEWVLESITASSLGAIGGVILTELWYFFCRYDWFV